MPVAAFSPHAARVARIARIDLYNLKPIEEGPGGGVMGRGGWVVHSVPLL